MVDIQHEPDVTDDEHMPRVKGFDDNKNVSNAAPTKMKLPMHVDAPTKMKLPMVDPPNAPPEPEYCSGKRFIALISVIAIIGVVLAYRVDWMHDEPHQTYKQQQPKIENKMNSPKQSGKCVVPPHPEHGEYIIKDAPTAKPGETFDALELSANCLPDYIASETDSVLCVNGKWSGLYPKCVRFCKLDNNPSVLYNCLVTGSIEGRRTCNAYEPSGTVVKPECNNSPKNSAITLPLMTCINGSWDYVAICSQECGRVTSKGAPLMTDGRPAERGELPWHVGIYRDPCDWPFTWLSPWECPYEQICGGSLVSTSVVISAAHCFWHNVKKKLPASKFAVAAGKVYRQWNNRKDKNAQKSNVKEINIPPRFQGNVMNFQDDIAVLILETPFEYTAVVGHVCLDFDINLETKQLQHGNLGKVAGWGLTAENGNRSKTLKVVELPYVNITQCIEASPEIFKGHITSDKICAGYGNGTALCKGDSGGGLVFPDSDRYYLRGIVSTAPTNENSCNIEALNAFTQIQNHEHFIKEHFDVEVPNANNT